MKETHTNNKINYLVCGGWQISKSKKFDPFNFASFLLDSQRVYFLFFFVVVVWSELNT